MQICFICLSNFRWTQELIPQHIYIFSKMHWSKIFLHIKCFGKIKYVYNFFLTISCKGINKSTNLKLIFSGMGEFGRLDCVMLKIYSINNVLGEMTIPSKFEVRLAKSEFYEFWKTGFFFFRFSAKFVQFSAIFFLWTCLENTWKISSSQPVNDANYVYTM